MCNVVAGQHNNVGVETINMVDTIPQIPAADGSAAMQVADVNYVLAVKLTGKPGQVQIDLNNFETLQAVSVDINRTGCMRIYVRQR